MRTLSARLLAATLFAAGFVPVGRAADPDLAMVPGDAAGFVHVRLADWWKHDLMKNLREAVQSAGPQALAAFEKQVYPSPASFDRATVIVLPPEGGRGEPVVVVVVRFSEAFDKDKALKLYAPGAVAKQSNGKAVYSSETDDFNTGFYFPDDRHVVVSKVPQLEAFLARPPVLQGGITPAVETAGKGMALVAAVNMKALPLPPQATQDVPENLRPLLKADRAVLTIDLKDAAPVISLRAGYAGERDVADAEVALKDGIKMAKAAMGKPKAEFLTALTAKQNQGPRPLKDLPELVGSLVGLGSMNQLDQLLDALPVKRDGNDLAATVTIPKEYLNVAGVYPVFIGLALPAVQKVREAAARTKSVNNLKMIGIGMHAHHDVFNKLGANIYSKDGKPLLSWRVAILPYLEQDALYKQFKLDEPWDSDHNKKLIDKMPQIYTIPNARDQPAGKTFYQCFVSEKGTTPRAMFVDDAADKNGFFSVTDGLSNTIMIVEAAEAVEWTKPADLPFDDKKDLPKLGGHSVGGFNVLLGDGSVRFVVQTVDKKKLKAAITANGGETLGLD